MGSLGVDMRWKKRSATEASSKKAAVVQFWLLGSGVWY